MEQIAQFEAAKSLYEAYVIAASTQRQNRVEFTISEEGYDHEKR